MKSLICWDIGNEEMTNARPDDWIPSGIIMNDARFFDLNIDLKSKVAELVINE